MSHLLEKSNVIYTRTSQKLAFRVCHLLYSNPQNNVSSSKKTFKTPTLVKQYAFMQIFLLAY